MKQALLGYQALAIGSLMALGSCGKTSPSGQNLSDPKGAAQRPVLAELPGPQSLPGPYPNPGANWTPPGGTGDALAGDAGEYTKRGPRTVWHLFYDCGTLPGSGRPAEMCNENPLAAPGFTPTDPAGKECSQSEVGQLKRNPAGYRLFVCAPGPLLIDPDPQKPEHFVWMLHFECGGGTGRPAATVCAAHTLVTPPDPSGKYCDLSLEGKLARTPNGARVFRCVKISQRGQIRLPIWHLEKDLAIRDPAEKEFYKKEPCRTPPDPTGNTCGGMEGKSCLTPVENRLFSCR